jgi:hypothetical protein
VGDEIGGGVDGGAVPRVGLPAVSLDERRPHGPAVVQLVHLDQPPQPVPLRPEQPRLLAEELQVVEKEIEIAHRIPLEARVARDVAHLKHRRQGHSHRVVPVVELSRALVQAGRLRGMREVGDLLARRCVDDAVRGGAFEVVENRVQLDLDGGLAGHRVVHPRRQRRLRERGLAAPGGLCIERGRHRQRRQQRPGHGCFASAG